MQMSKRTIYSDMWIPCCGRLIGGTYIKRMGYTFECAKCGKKFRGGFWIRAWLHGKLVNYENYSSIRKVFNRCLRSIFTKVGLC